MPSTLLIKRNQNATIVNKRMLLHEFKDTEYELKLEAPNNDPCGISLCK